MVGGKLIVERKHGSSKRERYRRYEKKRKRKRKDLVPQKKKAKDGRSRGCVCIFRVSLRVYRLGHYI